MQTTQQQQHEHHVQAQRQRAALHLNRQKIMANQQRQQQQLMAASAQQRQQQQQQKQQLQRQSQAHLQHQRVQPAAYDYFTLLDPTQKQMGYNTIVANCNQIWYSNRSYDGDAYFYRHAILPQEMVWLVPTSRLMSEREWRQLGLQMSDGWEQYLLNRLEPHVLLFRRKPISVEEVEAFYAANPDMRPQPRSFANPRGVSRAAVEQSANLSLQSASHSVDPSPLKAVNKKHQTAITVGGNARTEEDYAPPLGRSLPGSCGVAASVMDLTAIAEAADDSNDENTAECCDGDDKVSGDVNNVVNEKDVDDYQTPERQRLRNQQQNKSGCADDESTTSPGMTRMVTEEGGVSSVNTTLHDTTLDSLQASVIEE